MSITREDIEILYRVLLNREPDAEGLNQYMRHASMHNVTDLFALSTLIIQSSEFRTLHSLLSDKLASHPPYGGPDLTLHNYDFDRIAKTFILNATDQKWVDSTIDFYRQVAASDITPQRLEELYRVQRVPSDAYFNTHARRFCELFGWLQWQLASRTGGKLKLLEVGTSAHTTTIYRQLFDIELNTVCRPPDISDGPTSQWAIAMGSQQHWSLNLNELESVTRRLTEIPDNAYNFIICCEVVEHLIIDPSTVISQFLPKLAPDGLLFLSTPNYFRPNYVARVLDGRNPAHDFREYSNNKFAHHHFREYTPRELVDCVKAGGGKLASLVFSNCWSSSALDSPDEIPLRENLIVIATN